MPVTKADWIKMKMMDQYQEQLNAKARLRTHFGRRVFISYSRVDQEIASALSALLKSLAIDHFLDQKNIDWGSDITHEVKAGLRDCSHLLLVVSPASLKSSWVAYEIGQAAALGKVILPYLTHPSLELPSFISGLNYKSKMQDVRAFFETPEPGAEELSSTFSSLISFLPPDLHAYTHCAEESDSKKDTWRSRDSTPLPGRGGDGYGRITIDTTETLPTVSISYNEGGASYIVHHRKSVIAFDQEDQSITIFLSDLNNDGDFSQTRDRIAANSVFWLRLVEMLRFHIRSSLEVAEGEVARIPSGGENA